MHVHVSFVKIELEKYHVTNVWCSPVAVIIKKHLTGITEKDKHAQAIWRCVSIRFKIN